MHFLKVVLLFYALSAILAERSDKCSGSENSYLWKVKTTPPIYLYGTMHVPYKTLWSRIPDNVKVAFTSSQDMCLELEMLDKDTLRKLSSCRFLPEGVTIDAMLPADLVQRIERYLERIKEVLPKWMKLERGLGSFFSAVPTKDQLFASVVGDWRKVQPAWLMYHLDQLQEEHVQYLSTPVMDTFLEGAAKGMGKTVEAIEEPKDQCRPFRQLTNKQVALALRVLLGKLEKRLEGESEGTNTLEKDINIYRCGNFSNHISHTPILPFPPLDALNLTSAERDTLQDAEDALWQAIVVRRNRRMAKTIHALIKKHRNSSIFLGVGAGHFISASNVIGRLRAKGHVIDHIPADQTVPGLPVPDNIVALGDPSSVVRVLHISSTEPLPASAFTISDEVLNRVWNRFFATVSSSAPSTTGSSQQGGLNKRSEQSQDDYAAWRREVQDLLRRESAGAPPNSGGLRPATLLFIEYAVILVASLLTQFLTR